MPNLNFVRLIAPLSTNHGVGENIRINATVDSLYQKLRDARLNARAIERQSQRNIAKKERPDWEPVRQLAEQILQTQSKDLEVVSWLIEALLRQQAFAGLRDGFRLMRELIEKYWETIYPLPDDEGLLTRLAPLVGLNGEEIEGTLIVPIALLPLTQGHTEGPFALWQYQQAVEQLKIVDPEKRIQCQNADMVSMEKIVIATNETSIDFFDQLIIDIHSAIDEYKKLILVLEEKCQQETPPSSRILAQLNACLDCLNSITKQVLPKLDSTIKKNSVSITDNYLSAIKDVSEQKKSFVQFSSREEVLQSLLKTADYFRETEPHSPLSYMLERTVQWGRLSLPELMREIIKDEQAWGHVCSLTGIN